MHKLVDGIKHFQTNLFHNDQSLLESLVAGQSPRAMFITCSDSRIDLSRLTQTKPGDLFILRIAGNIVPPYGVVHGGEAATIEYAVSVLKVKNIVICGHSHCGAIAGLLSPKSLEQMPAVSAYLQHAEATRRIVEEKYADLLDSDKRLTLMVKENVLVQLDNLRTHASVTAATERGELRLHGWFYKFETGEVFAFNSDEGQFLPIEAFAPSTTTPAKTSLPI